MNSTLEIEDLNLEIAKTICSGIEDSEIRNRAVANALAAKIAKNFFTNISVDIESGIHNIPSILNKFDISDIYVENFRIDVRLHFDGDELSVPKTHYNKGILPLAYMFIKVSSDISRSTVTGFLLPEKIDFLTEDKNNHCRVNIEDFIQFEDLKPLFFTTKVEDTPIESQDFEIKLFDFLDDKLNTLDEDALIRVLIKSKEARLKLLDLSKVQSIFNFASKNNTKENINNDSQILNELLNETEINESVNDNKPHNKIDSNGQLDHLFENDNADSDFDTNEESFNNFNPKKKKSYFIHILTILILLSSLGYYAYEKLFNQETSHQNMIAKPIESAKKEKVEVMPIETIENKKENTNHNNDNKTIETTTASIPVMEKNIGSSIAVSNLNINWEVPSNYTSNNSVQRYLIKIGKIIQLNLKTELLLLSTPPVTNKIIIELEFDKKINKYKIKSFIKSSEEKIIDKVIEQTVNKVLLMDIKSNMKVFENLTGNPLLIIHL